MNYFGDLLYIKFKLSLLHYIIWIFCIKFCFIFMVLLLSWLYMQLYFLIELKTFYIILKKYKKLVFYGLLCFLYFLFPPDLLLQLPILILNIVLIEVFYFYICLIIQNTTSDKYANNTTTFKKIKKV
uniref:succinate dehydrogenase subunit 4 n=1 Tax=Hypnea edeniana TaxID=1524265 RepID=UPI0024114498|nr:succinate dehydrogenase subunit 4 [Hypnea edeniana]WDY85167.1 succinate dehydrogenase subunit 4 [Hypnea edeniana]